MPGYYTRYLVQQYHTADRLVILTVLAYCTAVIPDGTTVPAVGLKLHRTYAAS